MSSASIRGRPRDGNDPLCVFRVQEGGTPTSICFLSRNEDVDGCSEGDEDDRFETYEDRLVVGDDVGHLRTWSVATRRPMGAPVRIHKASVICIASTRFDRIVSQSRDGNVVVSTVDVVGEDEDGRRSAVISVASAIHLRAFTFCRMDTLHLSCGDTLLATPSFESNEFEMWRLDRTSSQLRQIVPARSLDPDAVDAGGMCMALRLFWRGDGDPALAVGFESGLVAIFIFEKPERLIDSGVSSSPTIKSKVVPIITSRLCDKPVLSVDVDSTGTYGVCVGASSSIVFFHVDWAKRIIEKRLCVNTPKKPGCSHVRLTPNEKMCAVAGWDHRVRMFQWRRRRLPKPIAVLRTHNASVSMVMFSKTSRYLASSSQDKTIALWDMDSMWTPQ